MISNSPILCVIRATRYPTESVAHPLLLPPAERKRQFEYLFETSKRIFQDPRIPSFNKQPAFKAAAQVIHELALQRAFSNPNDLPIVLLCRKKRRKSESPIATQEREKKPRLSRDFAGLVVNSQRKVG